jgi:hypothetical protein
MKRFLVTIALTSVLSVSALAGEMPGVGAPAPALPGDMPTCGLSSPGEIPTSGSTSPGEIPTCGLSALLAILDLAF